MSETPELWILQADGSKRQMTQDEYDRLRAGILANLSRHAIRSFSVCYLEGFCPVQAEGMVNGEPWYFRARANRWTLEIEDAVVAGAWGTKPAAAGWMPLPEALRLIATAIEIWGAQEQAGKESRNEAL